MKQLRFSHCPHCGGISIHTSIAYPFDRRIKIWWCSNFKGCGWVWCKVFGMWEMARNLEELEEIGGIEFDVNKVLKEEG